MKKVVTLVKYLMVGAYLVGGIMLAVFLLPQSGLKALSVATGSMTPAIPQGSLVIIRKLPTRQLRAGDVVTYINPANTRQTITHRIVETKTISGLPGFVTKGDANQAADKAILGGNVVGKVVWHLPVLGRVIDRVRNPIGLGLLVLVPAGLIVWDEVNRLRKALRENPTPEPEAMSAVKLEPAPIRRPAADIRPVLRRARKMDSVGRKTLGVFVALLFMGVGSTRAQLTSKASLIGNTISTAKIIAHPSATCGGSSSVTIANTAPGSTNNAIVTNNCNSSTTTSNTVSVTNSTTQTSISGSSNVSDNTGGSPTEPKTTVANKASTSTTVGVSNY